MFLCCSVIESASSKVITGCSPPVNGVGGCHLIVLLLNIVVALCCLWCSTSAHLMAPCHPRYKTATCSGGSASLQLFFCHSLGAFTSFQMSHCHLCGDFVSFYVSIWCLLVWLYYFTGVLMSLNKMALFCPRCSTAFLSGGSMFYCHFLCILCVTPGISSSLTDVAFWCHKCLTSYSLVWFCVIKFVHNHSLGVAYAHPMCSTATHRSDFMWSQVSHCLSLGWLCVVWAFK